MKVFRSLLLLILFTAVRCSAQITVREWPEWFLYPSRFPGLITGYSFNGHPAREDAANNYSLFRSCRVSGELNIYETSDTEDLGRKSDYYYDFYRDSSKDFTDKFIPLDKYIINVLSGSSIGAFAADTAGLPGTFTRIAEPAIPDWISRPPLADDTWYYGVGVFTSRGNDIDAWKSAEEKGIFEILRSISIKLANITINTDSGKERENLEKLSVYKFDYKLRNIQIVERYPDKKNAAYYALVRIRKSDVTDNTR